MPDMNENAETQQEYFGVRTEDKRNVLRLAKEAEEYVRQNYCEMCVMADDCKSGCIDCFTVQAYLASAEPREKRIEELEVTNKKISDECHKLVDTLEESSMKNAELKADNEARKFAMAMSEKVEKQLREENVELENDMKTAIPLLEKSVEISESLTKAIEIIEGLMRFCRCFAQHHTDDIRYKEAEQFISEVEK